MINLEDLTRTTSEFKLSSGEVFKLRACTLADESWMQRTFGKDIESIFKDVKMDELSRIVFHMMDTESRSKFLSKEIEECDEEGNKSVVKIGGVALFRTHIIDTRDKMAVLESLLETIGISRPVQKELMDEKKKSLLIGDTSSTPSQVSTDGQPNTF